ncbi:MAG TPA: CdaR family protein [Spirochaetota bacterium]|nr:CdaR family protein [Spirochaetota bacterium]HPN83387.1 CdaR family protein [Spirochaetota bacterium]
MSIRELFLRNWLQKTISMVLAVALFVFVRSMLTHELRVPVQLRIKNRPSYLMSVGKLEETITVTVRGIKSKIDSIDGTRITASVDMADAVPGLNEFPVILHYPGYSEDIQLTTSVRSLRIQMDYAMERMIPLVPVIKGNPSDGYIIYETNIVPAMLLVRGPAMILSNLASLPTMPFSVSGLKSAIASPVQVDLGNLNIEIRQSGQIVLRLGIVPERKARAFDSLVPVIEGLNPGLRMVQPEELPKVRVVLTGDSLKIDQLKDTEVRLVLSMTNLQKGIHEVRISPVLPDGIRVKSTDPGSVAVELAEGNP